MTPAPTTPEALDALVKAHFAENSTEALHIHGLQHDLYRAYPAVNFSSLKHIDDSPSKYRWELEHPTKRTKAMDYGTIVHGLCLTPEEVPGMWVKKAFKDFKTNEARAWRDAQTLIILDDEDLAEMTACAESVKSHPQGAWLLRESKPEVAIFRKHEATGLLLKARLDMNFTDLEGNRAIADIKKVQSVRPGLLSKVIAERSIHAQMAFYCAMDGASSAYLVAVEEAAPNDVVVRKLKQESLIRGTALFESWLTKLAKSVAEDKWPGPDGSAETVEEIEEAYWAQKHVEELTAA